MASSSSSSSSSALPGNTIPQTKHDVFLSFRGEDTRYNFISHLHAAMCRKQIDTFIDNQLRRGDEISPSLLQAIEASNISVIIFSQRYATSRWCLEELVKILECKNKFGQIVIPIFYGVDPSDVRHQRGNFGDSFSELEARFQERLDILQTWRSALREAANISGFDSREIRPESMLIEQIVDEVLKRLMDQFGANDDNDQLIGVESHIKEIELLLSSCSNDVCTLGIWGIGGIGKTTIASVIFKKISHHFEGYCFIPNVREEEENRRLHQLRQELLSRLLDDKNLKIEYTNNGLHFYNRRLSRKKVLIILDDVSDFKQIELLIGGLQFVAGSRIIITTRDKHVLLICRANKIYEIKKLAHNDALKLFSRHTFGQDNPDVGFEELSETLITYADGVPLALKVLGRFLVGRSKEEWQSAINKLKRVPNMEIQKVLQVSYDGLDDDEKNIFLDIACFFKGEDKDLVVKFLDASGFFGKIGISVLIDKSLVTVVNKRITMHDLLQEMGREIVRQESINNPGKRSRLWHEDDIYKVLVENTGTEAIQGISLDMSKVREIGLKSRIFINMRKLRILKFYGQNKFQTEHFPSRKSLLTELRYLCWHGCPLKSLSSNIHPENLVLLEIPDSNIKQLWNGTQNLLNLKKIDLHDSRQLAKLPDLSLASNLESLNLFGCTSLVETHSSIQHLNKLEFLNLKECKSLRKFSEISSCNMKTILLGGTAIDELPSSIGCLSNLNQLDLRTCKRLESLPNSLCNLKSLAILDISGCSNLQRFPDELGNLKALRWLDAKDTAIREVPSSIAYLNKLGILLLKPLRGHEQTGIVCPISLCFDGWQNINRLTLIDCGISELPESLGQLILLRGLFLQGNNFETLPASIVHLSDLNYLDLSYCVRLQSLPHLPGSIFNLRVHCCPSLEALSGLSILFALSTLWEQEYDLSNCFKLDGDELGQIVVDALQKIQRRATWWRNESPDFQRLSGHMCFPASEIPEWISFQSIGSCITLQLPPGWINNNYVGFVLCALVSLQDHHDNDQRFSVCCECKLKTREGHVVLGHVDDFKPLHVGTIRYLGAEHVVLGYDFFGLCSNDIGECEASFQFYLDDNYGELKESCSVKKCGIRLLYPQDFGESIDDTSGSFSSHDEQEEPLPKRSKCS